MDDSKFIPSEAIGVISRIIAAPSARRGSTVAQGAPNRIQAALREAFGAKRAYAVVWDTISVDNGRPYVWISIVGDHAGRGGDHRTRKIVRGPRASIDDATGIERRFLPIRESWEHDVDTLLLSAMQNTGSTNVNRLTLDAATLLVRLQGGLRARHPSSDFVGS